MKHLNQIIFLSILHKKVSYYPSIHITNAGSIVSLSEILQSNRHESVIKSLRNETDLLKQKLLKESLPCFTVAGVFNGRSNKGLVLPSGLAAVDLDSVEAYDPIQVLTELKKIPYIAYCGLSCRGKRLYCIVPFLYPDQYERHYKRLIKSFEDIGLPMGDNCHKIISQPRFVSYNTNETEFFNHAAKKFHLLAAKKEYYFENSNRVNNIPPDAFQWCVKQISKNFSFSENNRHRYLVKLVRYCNLKGIDETDCLKGCFQFIQNDFKEKEIIKVVKYVYTTQTNSFGKYPFSK